MARLSSLKVSSTHRVLLYGGPKSGKTRMAGMLAEHFKILYFGLENGHATLLSLPESWHDSIEVINLPDSRVFPIAIETMLKVIKGAPVEICEAHGKVSCAICKKESAPVVRVALNELGADTVVIVDSLTQLTNSAIAHITKNQPDDYKLNYDDWGNLGKLMDTFLSQVQQAQYNIICITHEAETELEDGKNKIVPVCGTRAFSRNTAKYFDEVVYCEVKNKKHLATSSTTATNNILTGSRSNVALETAPEPSLLRIFKPELFNDGVKSVGNTKGTEVSPGQTALSKLAALRGGTAK